MVNKILDQSENFMNNFKEYLDRDIDVTLAISALLVPLGTLIIGLPLTKIMGVDPVTAFAGAAATLTYALNIHHPLVDAYEKTKDENYVQERIQLN